MADQRLYVIRSIAAMQGSSKPHASREPYVAWVGMLRQPKRPDLLIEIAERSPESSIWSAVDLQAIGHRRDTAKESSNDSVDCQNIEFRGKVAPGEAERDDVPKRQRCSAPLIRKGSRIPFCRRGATAPRW